MVEVAHIINVTEINESNKASYLHIAQPVTIRSMVFARQAAKGIIDVDLVAVKYKAEKVVIPSEFRWAPDLDKYAWEHIEALNSVIPHKPLPLLSDIILSLYNSSNAGYFIFTNLDIGLYPHFYIKVRDMIESEHDAFCINRRDLPKEHGGVLFDERNIKLIFGLDGTKHMGIDCFVFKKEIVPLLKLGSVYVGYPPVGQVLKTQIEINSKNFIWIKDEKLTFHLGSDRAWSQEVGSCSRPYFDENYKQASGLYVRCFSME